MLRGVEILKAWKGTFTVEIFLDYDFRHRRRVLLEGPGKQDFMLDLADVPDLRDGDAIRLSSGDVVMVRAADEPLMEIVCQDPLHLARIAWHLGNRHLAAEIGERRILIREDHVIGHMVEGLGGKVRKVQAPFDPEKGAYAAPGAGHHHHHDDEHGHTHAHANMHRHKHG